MRATLLRIKHSIALLTERHAILFAVLDGMFLFAGVIIGLNGGENATALYIAVEAFDPDPKRIVGIRTRRDEPSPSDWVSVVIDSFHDRRSAFEFAVNPAGVKQDSYWFNDTNNDHVWQSGEHWRNPRSASLSLRCC